MDNSLTDLECGISDAMVRSAIDDKTFLPKTKLAELITKNEVEKQIGGSSDLVNYICERATKVFAIVVFVRVARSPEELGIIMEKFREHDFDDSCLPINEYLRDRTESHIEGRTEGSERPTCKNAGHTTCNHSPRLDAFHHHFWYSASIRAFYTDQWRFSAPVFSKNRLKHDFFPHDILPFAVFENSSQRQGHFSTVSKVKIHSGHQQVLIKHGDCEPHFAIKELKEVGKEEGYNVETAWNVETESLDKVSGLDAEHLIKPIAAYSRRKSHCFIFEWAEGGTLRDYWSENHTCNLSADLVREVLKQLCGLAKALNTLHNDSKAGSNNEKDDPDSNWRHGDLKPDNILRFLDSPNDHSKLGMLKIADLGLAKRHKYRTGLRDNPTETKFGTSQYEPPEAYTRPNDPRSRLYDIWSMGCIILEFIIWMLYGTEIVERFSSDGCPRTPGDGTSFFLVEDTGLPGRQARLNDKGARKWMDLILPHDPECNQDNTAIGELLYLVREKLLVVGLPDKVALGTPRRVDAGVLEQELRRISGRASVDDTYAFTGRDRANMSPPQPKPMKTDFLTPSAAQSPRGRDASSRTIRGQNSGIKHVVS